MFAGVGYYEPYFTTTDAWGLTPVDDINLGGMIMWVSGMLFVAAGVVLLGSWLAALERSDAVARADDDGESGSDPSTAAPSLLIWHREAASISPTATDASPARLACWRHDKVVPSQI